MKPSVTLTSHTWGQSFFSDRFSKPSPPPQRSSLPHAHTEPSCVCCETSSQALLRVLSRSMPRVLHLQMHTVSTHKNSLMLFLPLLPFEIKDANWEGGSEHLEKTVPPITHWYDPGYREGLDCHQCWLPVRATDFKQVGRAQSISENYAATLFLLLQGQIFFLVMVMVSDAGKKSILEACLRIQALLLGDIWWEILPASIVLHRITCHI